MWKGTAHPSGRAEYPVPYVAGTPIGEFLRVESLLRVAPHRLFELLNNVGPKWKSRKCWACGNKFIPDGSRCCSYCLMPLRDLRMLLSVRWDSDTYKMWEQTVSKRLAHFGLVTPVALYYRDQRMLAVHHFDGERLLMDEPAPWPAERLLTGLHFLCTVVAYLHDNGVVLTELTSRNVLVMPDDTVRLFDLDVMAVLDNPRSLPGHPSQPGLRMARALAEIGLKWCPPESRELRAVLLAARSGRYQSILPFAQDLEQLYQTGAVRPVGSRAAAMTDMGLVREHNEDNWVWLPFGTEGVVYVVADGMGGHHGGEIASQIACDTLAEQLANLSGGASTALAKGLQQAFLQANKAVVAQQTSNRRMGTTLVAAAVHGRAVAVASTGDSRAYLLRSGKLEQISVDHTVGQELVEAGKITREEMRNHPRGNLLTASIGGADDDLEVAIWTGDLRPGDRLLLCTDGLWGVVPEPEITRILTATVERREACQTLVKAAIDGGGGDNVTVIVIDG